MKRPTVVGLLALTGACSVLYDPNNLGTERADAPVETDAAIDSPVEIDAPIAIDAPIDAAIDAMIDAPPGPLMITNVASASPLHEGKGVGSRPALVILTVEDLVTSTPTLTLDPIMDGAVSRTATIVASRVSTDRTKIVLALQIPVLTATADAATKALHLTVAQAGSSAEVDLTIAGLDELAPATATVNTSTLRGLYSRATFSSPVHFIGTAPALIRVTSDISITAAVDVDGQGASAGAHGCNGGGAATAGGCGTSGGGGGNSGLGGSAGGGGGFGAAGATGQGNTPGGGGVASGDDLLISLTTNDGAAGNRGNGGGGGGGATLGGGGPGGGGGGALELTADGAITVTGSGAARANGGNGTAGGGIGGGNGGGGSGGAIVIRAGAGISAPAAWVAAAGGIGAGASNRGGNGSIGRVRIDAPSSISGMVTGPIARRGAAWVTTTPVIVATPPAAIEIAGEIGLNYGITVNNVAQPAVLVGSGGTGMLTPTPALVVGSNTLCVLASLTATLGNLESVRCIEIAYLP